jgi:hypothetical protein
MNESFVSLELGLISAIILAYLLMVGDFSIMDGAAEIEAVPRPEYDRVGRGGCLFLP